jgi:membrane protease YdiL (CAAX protease family)
VAYGWLARWGVPVAIVGSAVLFAAVHVPLYGTEVLPVDLGAGLLLDGNAGPPEPGRCRP